METGDDGALDHNEELLPTLSKSSSKMKFERLLDHPLPSFEGNNPGSPFWTAIGYYSLAKVLQNQFRTVETSGLEHIPDSTGSLCAAWHTNGLIDPISIMTTHPHKFVIGGRHDLLTRPILGFWSRKFAVQPVIRKAELLRGGCSEEQATSLNGRSLLNLSTGITHGFGCVLFPEGTSHSESKLIRLRTGPMRTVLCSAALSRHRGQKDPVILPVGLHYRTRHLFRTDLWVEYSEPIDLSEIELPSQLVEAVADAKWSEPPADAVIGLRDEVERRLSPLTPGEDTWADHRATHLLAHLSARIKGEKLDTWRKEVLAARAIRDGAGDQAIKEQALVVAASLKKGGLDGRDINSNGDGLRKSSLISGIKGTVLLVFCLSLLPLFIISGLPQVILGRVFGDRTDEGLDARTSYHFLAALFGSVIIWPITVAVLLSTFFLVEIPGVDVSFITNANIGLQMLFSLVFIILSPIPLWLIGRTFSWAWDVYTDFKKHFNRMGKKELSSQILQLKEAMITSGRYL